MLVTPPKNCAYEQNKKDRSWLNLSLVVATVACGLAGLSTEDSEQRQVLLGVAGLLYGT